MRASVDNLESTVAADLGSFWNSDVATVHAPWQEILICVRRGATVAGNSNFGRAHAGQSTAKSVSFEIQTSHHRLSIECSKIKKTKKIN